jgi:hypothetical protein
MGYNPIGKKRAEEIAELIMKRGLKIRFWIMCRADSFNENNDHLLSRLKQAGLFGMLLGLEGGCQSVLDTYNKSIKLKRNFEIVRLLRRHNIIFEVGYIMFYPYITFNELRKNALFLCQINESCVFKYLAEYLELYPGTSFVEQLKRKNLLLSEYSYRAISAYKFADPRIKRLLNWVTQLGKDLRFSDAIIWSIEHISQLLIEIISESKKTETNQELVQTLLPISSAIILKKSRLSRINYNKFTNYLEFAQKERSDQEMEKIRMFHVKEVFQINSEISTQIQRLYGLKNKLVELKHGYVFDWFFRSHIFELLTSKETL